MEKKKHIKVESVFPIELMAVGGKFYLRDLLNHVYEIQQANGNPITISQWNEIIEKKYGFWDMAKLFKLVVGNYNIDAHPKTVS